MRRIVLFGITLIVGLSALALGFWQLGRLGTRRAANRIAVSGHQLPPLLPDEAGHTALIPNRRATLVGELDEPHEFLLRNRLVQGVPAVLVVTPLRTSGGDTAVLVNRGYVPAPDAVDPVGATWSEASRKSFHGVLLPMPDRGDGTPLRHRERETWRSLDLEQMRSRLPYPVAAVYLLAEPDPGSGAHTIRGAEYPFRAEVPPTDDGPHLLYAIQWFGIAAAVLAFGVFFVLTRPAPVVC